MTLTPCNKFLFTADAKSYLYQWKIDSSKNMEIQFIHDYKQGVIDGHIPYSKDGRLHVNTIEVLSNEKYLFVTDDYGELNKFCIHEKKFLNKSEKATQG